MKKILLTVSSIILLAAACNQNQPQPGQNQQVAQNQNNTNTQAAGFQTYKNDNYDFELTFSNIWSGYRAGGVYGSNYSYIPFSIPDKDGNYSDQFSILVYTKPEWIKMMNKNSTGINFIIEDEDNVYAYQLAQDSGYKLPNLDSEVLKVASTFKFAGLSSEEAKRLINNRVQEVILALKNKDSQKLSNFTHPDKGIRFSPYTYVSTSDKVFTKSQVKTLFQNNTKYLWGYTDGKGDPINLTFKDYYSRYVFDQNFLQVGEISYNEPRGKGNTINNILGFYKNSIVVEYYFPGREEQYAGMDWKSLKLVFQEKDKIWYLVGVVHDEWTI